MEKAVFVNELLKLGGSNNRHLLQRTFSSGAVAICITLSESNILYVEITPNDEVGLSFMSDDKDDNPFSGADEAFDDYAAALDFIKNHIT